MRHFLVFLGFLIWITPAARAETCEQQNAARRQAFYSRYRVVEMRQITTRVLAHLTSAEREELLDLSKKFNSIPHDTPEHQLERYALQKRAREIDRAATARSGYTLLNPADGSPYDALIGEQDFPDGTTDYLIEVRDILVFSDPRPHVTLWMGRLDPAHNPDFIVTIGIMADPAGDYVSWKPQGGNRISGSVDQFIQSLLPPNCQ